MTERTKRGPGRPTKFEDKRVGKILRAVRAGNYLETAARMAGVGASTLHRWMASEEEGFRDFREAVEKARAEAEAADLKLLRSLGVKHGAWQSLAWRLERRNPVLWGVRLKVMVDAEVETMLDKLRAALPAEWYEVALAALASDGGLAAPRSAPGGGSAGSDAAP